MFKIAKDYFQARQEFRGSLSLVQRYFPQGALEVYPVLADLTIDCIYAPPPPGGNLLVLTSGLHGIEGYVGAAALQSFVQYIVPELPPERWGFALVHPLNPWGMANWRRVNENNVDLNRNFIWEWTIETEPNPDYLKARRVMEPSRPLSTIQFSLAYAAALGQYGQEAMVRAATMGQYSSPSGVYFGGHGPEASTKIVQNLFRRLALDGHHLLFLDIHTGYGPKGQLTMVNSPLEKRPAQEFLRALGWPHVVAADPENFYAILGDMGDWLYRMMEAEYPGKPFLATCYEYGTLGDSPAQGLESMRRIINENSAWQSRGHQGPTRVPFQQLFAPQEQTWLSRAEADFLHLTKTLLQHWQD